MIYIENIRKEYKRYTVPFNSLKSFIINNKQFHTENSKIKSLIVIDNLTLHISAGDLLCIVGKNGAGKSTLAKIIAGTVEPNNGKVIVNGSIVPFLELGVAFNSELSGRDNVLLNGALLGLSNKYMISQMDEIFKYAEISEFIDTPLKYYSSGMLMKLAFSIGMHADGDIYIFDEVLAVGDFNFQQKCLNSFNELVKKKKTVILVTHSFETVSAYATKVLLINEGKWKLISERSVIAEIKNQSLEEIINLI